MTLSGSFWLYVDTILGDNKTQYLWHPPVGDPNDGGTLGYWAVMIDDGGTTANNQPNPWVTAATDVAGIVGLFLKEKVAKPLGRVGSAASIWNDPSLQNVMTNLLGLVKGFEAPMAITGAFNDAFDYGINNSNGRIDNGAYVIPATVSNGEISISNPELAPWGGFCN